MEVYKKLNRTTVFTINFAKMQVCKKIYNLESITTLKIKL